MNDRNPVTIALIGAGSRGELNLGYLLKRHPGTMQFIAVAERDEERRERFIQDYGIRRKHAFSDWQELLSGARLTDAVIIALPCHLHFPATLAALKAGYHVLLEKPMAHSPGECLHLARTAEAAQRILMIALQCRYNRIYSEISRLLKSGAIGRLMNIDCAENIGYWHFIMSYVRGMHSESRDSHSFMLAKGIHDIDLLNWFTGGRALRISSFGRLSFFNKDHAPKGAPARCTNGCSVQDTCEFDAVKQYLSPGKPNIPLALLSGMSLRAVLDYAREPRLRTLASTIVRDISRENILKTLKEGPHGRCVFHCDNDVVDHQVVSIEYDNDITVSFSLSAFSLTWERSCNFHGTQGEIKSQDFSGRLETRVFNPAGVHKKRIRYHGIFHGGGDEQLLLKFAEAVKHHITINAAPNAASQTESHLIAFAAEESRISGRTILMDPFRQRAEKDAALLAVQH